jgi:hypothetical protein
MKELFRVALLELFRTTNPKLTITVGSGSSSGDSGGVDDFAEPYMKNTGEISQTEGEKKKRMREHQHAEDEKKRIYGEVFKSEGDGASRFRHDTSSDNKVNNDGDNGMVFTSLPILYPPEARRESKHKSSYVPYSVKYRFYYELLYLSFFFFFLFI